MSIESRERSKEIAAPALDLLKNYGEATTKQLIEACADGTLTATSLSSAISVCYLNAFDDWAYVNRVTVTPNRNAEMLYRYDREAPPREPVPAEERQTRWRRDKTVAIARKFLAKNRGVTYTAAELAEAIGYPGQVGSLVSALREGRVTAEGSSIRHEPVVVGGKVMTAYWVGAKARPDQVLAQATARDDTPAPPEPEQVEANRFELPGPSRMHEPCVATLARPVIEAEVIAKDPEIGIAAPHPPRVPDVEIVHREDSFMLVRTADGKLWEATPFRRS